MTPVRRTAQTVARNVADLLYEVTPGSVRNTYPNGAGTPPVAVALTATERAAASARLADALEEWGDVDPDGRAAWEAEFMNDADAAPEAYAMRGTSARAVS